MGDYELYHARSHKYIKKIGNRYFYSQDEIQAYLNKGDKKLHIADVDKIKDFNSGKTIGRRVYYDRNKEGGYDKSIGVIAEKKKITLQTTDKDYTLDLAKKKDRRKKKGTSVAKKHLKKPLNSLKSSVSKGKKALSRAMPRIGHETTVKSGGVETTTVTYKDGSSTSTKSSKSKSIVGHNTTINSGGHTTSTASKKRRTNSGHNTKIKTRQIK